MGIIERRLSLVGDNDGKTVTLQAGGSRYEFVDGSITLEGPSRDVDNLSKFLLRNWQAYPDPSLELDAARAALEESGDVPETDPDEDPQGDEHPGGAADDEGGGGEQPTEPPHPTDGGSDADPELGGEEPGPAGGGDGQAPILRALRTLDHGDDELWTLGGQPKMAAVENAMGRSDVTRAQVNAAAPDFVRENPHAKAD